MDVYLGQTGTARLVMLDANGNPTDTYDTAEGVSYISSNDEIATIADEDAEPKDAQITLLRAHQAGEDDVTFTVEFDGDPSGEMRSIIVVSDPIRVLEPPPGEAMGGEFTLAFREA